MSEVLNCSSVILLGTNWLTSYFIGYKATTAGAKHQEALNHLEKKLKNQQELDHQDTLELAIMTLSTVLSMDFKPQDLEIGVVTKANPRFVQLSEAEIEEQLNRIAEKAD